VDILIACFLEAFEKFDLIKPTIEAYNGIYLKSDRFKYMHTRYNTF
jgi:hypothetical protein